MRESGACSFWRVACAAALAAATVGLVAACKQVEMASGWATDGVEVDGVNDEWIGAVTYFEKQDVTVGLLNDDEFLYVSLVTSGPVAQAESLLGPLDILVNNAGIWPPSTVAHMKEQDWDRVLDVNLKGVFLCSQAAIRSMAPRQQGRIVNIASGRGVAGSPLGAHYAASLLPSIP